MRRGETISKGFKKCLTLIAKSNGKFFLVMILVIASVGIAIGKYGTMENKSTWLYIQSGFLTLTVSMFTVCEALRGYFSEFAFMQQRDYYDLANLLSDTKFATDFDKSRVVSTLRNHDCNKKSFFKANNHFH